MKGDLATTDASKVKVLNLTLKRDEGVQRGNTWTMIHIGNDDDDNNNGHETDAAGADDDGDDEIMVNFEWQISLPGGR